jgi:hypothetical protein
MPVTWRQLPLKVDAVHELSLASARRDKRARGPRPIYDDPTAVPRPAEELELGEQPGAAAR